MSKSSKLIAAGAAGLLALWLASHASLFADDTDAIGRLIVGLVFSVLIVLRPKPEGARILALPGWVISAVAVAGTALAIIGIVLPIHQFSWLGMLTLVIACLAWALPPAYRRDLLAAAFVAYFIHPLPSQVLGTLALAAQTLSIRGAELLLQIFNVRVWADSVALYTTFRRFLVPDICSGLRTAFPVLLCAAGSGVLFRLRAYQTLILVLAGLVQVWALNVLRISFMVALSASRPETWSDTFLHDTTGFLLLLSVLLVQVEAAIWNGRRLRQLRNDQAVLAGTREPEDRASIFNLFWLRVIRWYKPVLLLLLLTGVAAAAAYKCRPHHRALMISGVLEGLSRLNLEKADEASAEALRLAPAIPEIRSQRIVILLLRAKFDGALGELRSLPAGQRTDFHTVLKAWAMMGKQDPQAAIDLVESLPESTRSLPGVAIVRAEFAATQNDPAAVAANIQSAMSSHLFIHRVRELFLCLADGEQWEAIARCHSTEPFRTLPQANLAVLACLKVSRLYEAGEALKVAMQRWPDDPQLIEYAAALAIVRPGSRWEQLFARKLEANIRQLTPDQLAIQLDNSFRMNRPDLAWLTYRGLAELDPSDPALALAPAQYGVRWFTFRKHHFGVASEDPTETADFSGYFRRRLSVLDIPLATELMQHDTAAFRKQALNRSLEELARRERETRLTFRMWMSYLSALEQAGRRPEQLALLDRLERAYPGQRRELLFRRATVYNETDDWQRLYETLRDESSVLGQHHTAAELMKIHALLRCGLGVQALLAADRASHGGPWQPEMHRAKAAILAANGLTAEALVELQKSGEKSHDPFAIELLTQTQRYVEANRMLRVAGERALRITPTTRQSFLPVPAEQVLAAPPPRKPSEAEMAEQANRRATSAEHGASPFIAGLDRLTAEWYRGRARTVALEPDRWTAVGRDDTEKAMALHRYSFLLWEQGRTADALTAGRAAVTLAPDSASLWRVVVALGDATPETLADARQHCPQDPELWLAQLVTTVRRQPDARLALAEVNNAIAQDVFPPETLVRAGDFLRREKLLEAATRSADHAMKQARSLLSPYVLGLRCALAVNDNRKAVACAEQGVELAADPWPFYKVLALLRVSDRRDDPDTAAVLEKLVAQFPSDPSWSLALGNLYLEKGDPKRAFALLKSFVVERPTGPQLRTALSAAEAARRAGQQERATVLLEKIHAQLPDDVVVLNNLVHTLAGDPLTARRAAALMPDLVKAWGESFMIYDTAALVYWRTGDPVRARESLQKALEWVDRTDPLWFRLNPNMLDLDAYIDKPGPDGVLMKDRQEMITLAREIARKIKARAAQP